MYKGKKKKMSHKKIKEIREWVLTICQIATVILSIIQIILVLTSKYGKGLKSPTYFYRIA